MKEDSSLLFTGLSRSIIVEMQDIFSKYPAVEQVKIYGSRVKATYRDNSDIDLAVYGNKLDSFLLSTILFELEESTIPYTVDIQIYSKITNKDLQDHIDRLGVLVYHCL